MTIIERFALSAALLAVLSLGGCIGQDRYSETAPYEGAQEAAEDPAGIQPDEALHTGANSEPGQSSESGEYVQP